MPLDAVFEIVGLQLLATSVREGRAMATTFNTQSRELPFIHPDDMPDQFALTGATGLTPVHVNRTLKQLDKDGPIERQRRFVRIPDWTLLGNVAGFNETYLHLDQLAG